MEGFDLGLAITALFYSSKSTLRIEGYNFPIKKHFDISDAAIELQVNKKEFDKICLFIHNSYKHKFNGRVSEIEKNYNSKIIFYEAEGKYYIFNTCNTWLAKCLNSAGLKVDDTIILTEELLKDASRIGKIVGSKK